MTVHPAAKLQFERAVREFFRWRPVPESERSPAPAWWWHPAFQVLNTQEEMDPQWCYRLELPFSSTHAAGAAVLMAQLAGQTSMLQADELPKKMERAEAEENWPVSSDLDFSRLRREGRFIARLL